MTSSGIGYKKIGIAAAIMMISVFLSRIIGIVREMVIASIGGASGDVDAYQVAFIIPEILNHIVASGFLSVTFIPIFSKYLARNEEEEGWRIFSIILTSFGTLLLFFIAISFLLAPPLIAIVAPGWDNPSLLEKAIRMTRIIIPAQFFFFTGGMLMAVQFAKKKFAVPALAPLIYNIGIIAGGCFLGHRIGVEGFSWGVIAGAVLGNFAIQYWGAKKIGMKFTIIFDFRNPELKKYILLTLPLMFGLTMSFSAEFFLKFFGSYLPEGNIAGINYGFRIMQSMSGLFGQAVGMASFPFMASLVAKNKIDEMNRLLNNTLRFISLVIPFSALLMVLRHETILILFQRGQFDAAATALTSGILPFLLAGAFGFSAQTIVARGFYAMQNTIIPAVFVTAAVIISIPVYWYGMKIMGVCGIALANSISITIQVAILYAVWNRRSNNRGSKTVYLFIIKMIVVSILIGFFLEWFKTTFLSGIDAVTFTGSLMISAITGGLFVAVLLAAGYLLKIDEVLILFKKLAGNK